MYSRMGGSSSLSQEFAEAPLPAAPGERCPCLLALMVAEFPGRSLRHTLDEPASFYTPSFLYHGGDPSKALHSGGV